MDNKVALFAFNGELLCFVHVLLNGLDMAERGVTAEIVLEGMSVKLVEELEKDACPFHGLWTQARAKGIVAGACRACSAKLGALEAVEKAGLALLDDMKGHPSMAAYRERGFTIITF